MLTSRVSLHTALSQLGVSRSMLVNTALSGASFLERNGLLDCGVVTQP